jgi:hypothetical protein
MTAEEYKEHKRQLRAKSRANQTPMKAAWARRKDRERKQRQRHEKVLKGKFWIFISLFCF